MIKKPNDWDSVQPYGVARKAPACGAYICRVKQVSINELSNGSEQMAILFDITEGEFTNYYTEDYKSRKNYDSEAKWRGVLKVWLPKENDNSDLNQSSKSRLKGVITSFEESNSGYHWNWDEQSLKGLQIGVLYRDEEWANREKGTTGWKAQPFMALSTQAVRDGKYVLPKEKELPEEDKLYSPPIAYEKQTPKFENLVDDDGDLPF